MTRHPDDVPVTHIFSADQLPELGEALGRAVRVAIDTETCRWTDTSIGSMRVMSVATRDESGIEHSWVIDVRDVDGARLAPLFDGVSADGWNADFDARVTDAAIFEPAGLGRGHGIVWWDAMIGDALLHQGRSGFGWFHGLAWATTRYLGFEAEGKGTIQTSFTAEDDLSTDQIRYAAADAVETLWVSDAIRKLIADAELDEIMAIETEARPFLDYMERHGLPIDWPGWLGRLAEREHAQSACIGRLADLTGGGQANLFSDAVEPSWNPASEEQAKAILNRFEPDRVRARFAARGEAPRLLSGFDSLTATGLREIGGPIADALLEFRDHAKVLSTYGSNLETFLHEDGRFHSQYVQVVGANTGRLSSRRPNAQNLAPELAPFLRPADPARTFVYADLSQAELRWLAQVSGDRAMQEAFAAGVDVHVATAERMFGVDMVGLAATDRGHRDLLRARAKTINFGIVYGQGPRALAHGLSEAGTETTVDEARALLDAYLAAYPDVAAWLKAQDSIVTSIVEPLPAVDWNLTLELHELFRPVQLMRREFRDRVDRWPTLDEILDVFEPQANVERDLVGELGRPPTPSELDERRILLRKRHRWVSRHEEAVILLHGGARLRWEARTLGGRRRQFDVRTDGVIRSAGRLLLTATTSWAADLRARVEADTGVPFASTDICTSDRATNRALDDREVRRRIIDLARAEHGEPLVEEFLNDALVDRVNAAANAFRNAPIQGGVADAMLVSYGALWDRIKDDEEIWPVQTVHDSIVLECPTDRSVEVGQLLRDMMEQSFTRFCPQVDGKADTDIRSSLASSDVTATIG